MRLFNHTAAAAQVLVGAQPADDGHALAIGLLVAKATFVVDRRGRVTPDTQSPLPLLARDQDTPLGPLPADLVARRGDRFEVMLLGHGYPRPGRRQDTASRVALTVGRQRREMAIFGDRVWIGDRPGARAIAGPRPFDRMPLTYDRAFGGSFPVQIDADTVVDVFDPVNRRGRGFDAELRAEGLAKTLRAPRGFPILRDYRRWLPNLEDPRAPIQRWDDAPDPVGWAPTCRDTAVGLLRRIRGAPEPGHEDPDRWLYRAHPDWIIDPPPEGAPIRLENLVASTPVVELALPAVRLIADFVVYGRTGERELMPQALLLLPEELKLCLVYRALFTFEDGPAHERAFRLRAAPGWFQR